MLTLRIKQYEFIVIFAEGLMPNIAN